MNKIFEKAKIHWVALVLSLFFGVLTVSPHIQTLTNISSPDFKGVYQTFNDDQIYYEARIAAVTRGNWGISNVYIKEHEKDFFLQPPVAEWIIALPVLVFGFSVPFAVIFCTLILVPLSFTLLYWVFYCIFKRRSLSIFYTVLFFLFFINSFGRLINPQVTAPLFFLGLILIQRIYNDKTSSDKDLKFLNVLLGLNMGVSLIISPYFGTALMVFYFLSITAKDIFKKGIFAIVRDSKWFLLAFTPLALLYAFFITKAQHLPYYAETAERFGLIYTHSLGSYTNILLATMGLILFQVFRKRINPENTWVVCSLVTSIFILNWQNVITGQILQFSSHYYMVTVVFLLLVTAIVYSSINNGENRKVGLFPAPATIFIICILLFLSYIQHTEIKSLWKNINNQDFSVIQNKGDVFKWLNEETAHGSVVYSLGGDYDYLIPVYTNNKVYYNFYATGFVMSNNELEDRWLNQQIFNINFNENYIIEHQREFWLNRFIDVYQFRENQKRILALFTGKLYVSSVRIGNDLVDSLMGKYEQKKKNNPLSVLKSYKIDYILVSPDYTFYNETIKMLDKDSSIRLITVINGVYIYQF